MNLSQYEYYRTDLGVLYCGDCLDIMPYIEPIELLLTDPPYGLNSKMNGGTWGVKYRNGDMLRWDYTINQYDYDKILKYGKIKIIWGANNYITAPSRCWLIWQKPFLPTLSEFEMAWTNIDLPSKIFKSQRIQQNGHPTAKPVQLFIYCIEFSKTNGIVFDPFFGSGTTAIASERLGRRWIGIEIEEKYCEIAKKRIELERKQLKLF